MEYGDEGQSFARHCGAVDAARENGFAAVSANDHFLFQMPWLDGTTALAPVDQAELMIELEVLTPVVCGWTEPIATTVVASHTPSVCVGDRIGLRLVAKPDAKTFNGTLISVRGGERWLTYAHCLADGTIVPDDGTRRIAA